MPCFSVDCGSTIMEVDCPTYKADLREVCAQLPFCQINHITTQKGYAKCETTDNTCSSFKLARKTSQWNLNWTNEFILEQHSHMADVFFIE